MLCQFFQSVDSRVGVEGNLFDHTRIPMIALPVQRLGSCVGSRTEVATKIVCAAPNPCQAKNIGTSANELNPVNGLVKMIVPPLSANLRKLDLPSPPLGVFVAQVSVGFHRQCSTVLVAQPA